MNKLSQARNVIKHRLPGAPNSWTLEIFCWCFWSALWSRINMVAEDGNFYFRKTSLGTGFSACNCLFDSRNCLLTSLKLGSYYKLNWPKRAPAVYWLLGTLLYPCLLLKKKMFFGLCFNSKERNKRILGPLIAQNWVPFLWFLGPLEIVEQWVCFSIKDFDVGVMAESPHPG